MSLLHAVLQLYLLGECEWVLLQQFEKLLTSALGHCHVEEAAGRFIDAAPEQCPGQSQEPVPWGAGGVCPGMCSGISSGDLQQRSWAEGSGTRPAESPLQDLPVVFNPSWARKCEQNYQILCETNSTSSSGDADVPSEAEAALQPCQQPLSPSHYIFSPEGAH